MVELMIVIKLVPGFVIGAEFDITLRSFSHSVTP